MAINIEWQYIKQGEKYMELIENVLNVAHTHLSHKHVFQLGIQLVDDNTIRGINKDYREVDASTDVLSFPIMSFLLPNEINEKNIEIDYDTHEVVLGDIVISVETALEQAVQYNHSVDREIAFLALHGFLHLFGYDHTNENDENEMMKVAKMILEKANQNR